MKKSLILTALFLLNISIKANNSSNSFKVFCKTLERQSVFQQPQSPNIFPGLYSVKSLLQESGYRKINYSDIPKSQILYFKKWTKTIFRPKYVAEEFSSQNIRAIPNVKCFTQKGANGDIIYNYEVDSLIFQSSNNKTMSIWDTGKFIGIFISKENVITGNESIREKIEKIVVKYTNYSIEEIKKFSFDFKNINGFKVGSFKGKPYKPPNIPDCKIYSWNTFISYAIGSDFVILMFPERTADNGIMRARLGEFNRF